MEDEEFISVCPKCKKTHIQFLTSDQLDFLKECEEIVDTLMVIDVCEDCQNKER